MKRSTEFEVGLKIIGKAKKKQASLDEIEVSYMQTPF